MKKHLTLPLCLILSTSLFAGALGNKATSVEILLSDMDDNVLLESFEKASMMGSAMSMIMKDEEIKKELAVMVRKAIEDTAIKAFTAEELDVLVQMNSSDPVRKQLATKTLVMAISTDPQSAMGFSQLMMKASQNMMIESQAKINEHQKKAKN